MNLEIILENVKLKRIYVLGAKHVLRQVAPHLNIIRKPRKQKPIKISALDVNYVFRFVLLKQ